MNTVPSSCDDQMGIKRSPLEVSFGSMSNTLKMVTPIIRLNRPVFVRQQCEPAELYLDDVAGCLTTADAGIRADLDGAPIHRLPVRCGPALSTNTSNDGISRNDTVPYSETWGDEKSVADLVRVKVGGPGELLSLPQSFG
ncbi:hypothetical protein FBUS_10828 [Fasciolopsis buskii]|uniref:Uncharacterized protein n=1 Tax=Fasciolopsis buskii TaxID=27845 RepID=A0A8E0VES6_9TREM|nr:hypothetical protein FBUS_10828 [Fasciolopsis buski]